MSQSRAEQYGIVASLAFATMLGLAGWSAAAENSTFDGVWQVGIFCGPSRDMAKPYRWTFPANVRNGALNGQYGDAGSPGSGTLTGKINSAGDALLRMVGKTGDPNHTAGHVDIGSAFHYTANVHFDGSHGSGKRVELRDCSLDFSK
jgi:hypothetical protein